TGLPSPSNQKPLVTARLAQSVVRDRCPRNRRAQAREASDMSSNGSTLRGSGIAAGVLAATALLVGPSAARAQANGAPTQFNDMTVAQMQSAMTAGTTNSVALTNFYINRILKLDQ